MEPSAACRLCLATQLEPGHRQVMAPALPTCPPVNPPLALSGVPACGAGTSLSVKNGSWGLEGDLPHSIPAAAPRDTPDSPDGLSPVTPHSPSDGLHVRLNRGGRTPGGGCRGQCAGRQQWPGRGGSLQREPRTTVILAPASPIPAGAGPPSQPTPTSRVACPTLEATRMPWGRRDPGGGGVGGAVRAPAGSWHHQSLGGLAKARLLTVCLRPASGSRVGLHALWVRGTCLTLTHLFGPPTRPGS